MTNVIFFFFLMKASLMHITDDHYVRTPSPAASFSRTPGTSGVAAPGVLTPRRAGRCSLLWSAQTPGQAIIVWRRCCRLIITIVRSDWKLRCIRLIITILRSDWKINNITLSRCGGAAVLPLAPLEPDSAWACDQCGLRLEAEEQQETLCQALEVRR